LGEGAVVAAPKEARFFRREEEVAALMEALFYQAAEVERARLDDLRRVEVAAEAGVGEGPVARLRWGGRVAQAVAREAAGPLADGKADVGHVEATEEVEQEWAQETGVRAEKGVQVEVHLQEMGVRAEEGVRVEVHLQESGKHAEECYGTAGAVAEQEEGGWLSMKTSPVVHVPLVEVRAGEAFSSWGLRLTQLHSSVHHARNS
jgi:hypothetical protein